jgi:murein DD-endopeptidase MepM/ murein hydrolase activator NlpD
MARDISKLDPKVTRQDRKLDRRESILPNRRITQAPDLQINADVRQGRIGGAGAEDVLRALSSVDKGLSAFQAYSEKKQAVQDDKDAAEGVLDAEAGTIDAAMLERSNAYKTSVTLANTKRDWYTALEDLDDKVKATLAEQTDPDPAVREAAVQAVIEDHFQSFALDTETGDLKDFGSPAAQRWLAEQMGSSRQKIVSDTFQLIENRMNEESLTTYSDAVRAKLKAGQEFNLEDEFDILLPTVDRKAAKMAAISTVKEVSAEFRDEAVRLYATDPEQAKVYEKKAVDALRRLRNSLDTTGALQEVELPPSGTPVETPETIATDKTVAKQKPATVPGKLVAPVDGFEKMAPSSGFGVKRATGTHNGLDVPMPKGTPIKAPMDGIVEVSEHKYGGRQVVVKMANGDRFGVAHLSEWKVKDGQKVVAGQVVGLSGNTGRVRGKGGGYHAHFTVTKGGKKVDPAAYFKNSSNAPSGDAYTAGPTFEQIAGASEEVYDPSKPSERILGSIPGTGLNAPKGVFALSSAERAEIKELERSTLDTLDNAAKTALRENQTVVASEFADRLFGVGSPVSSREIQEARRTGKLSSEHASQLLGVIERRQDQEEAEARQAVAEQNAASAAAEQAQRERKEGFLKGSVNSILSPLVRGTMTVSEANNEILRIAASISDLEIQTAFIREARGSAAAIGEIRQRTPEVQQGMQTLTSWKNQYIQSLKGSAIPAGKRDVAAAEISAWVDEYIVWLGRGDVDPKGIAAFLATAEKNLDQQVRSAYPPRAKPKQ